MACEKKTFTEITDSVMTGIRRGLAAMDMALPDADQGALHSAAYNVTAFYDFKRDQRILTVEVTEKPFFVPCAYIYKKIEEAVERARAHG